MKLPDHYSPSQLTMASDCGRKYYYQYIKGIKPRGPNPFFIIGSAADRTVELVLSAPEGSLSPSEIFQEEFKKEMDQFKPEAFTEDQMNTLNKQSVQMEVLLTNYVNNYIDYEPLSFQRRLSLSLKGIGPVIYGYSDIIAKRGGDLVILDIKTSGLSVSEPSATHRSQLMFYCLALMKMDKLEVPPKLELHYLIKTKEPKINVVPVEVSEANLYHVVTSIREHDWRINKGYFPLNRNSIWCTPSGCENYELCHSECKMEINDAIAQCV